MECRKEYVIKAKSLDDLREKLDRITDEIAAEAEAELEALHTVTQEDHDVIDKALEVWTEHEQAVKAHFKAHIREMMAQGNGLDFVKHAYCCGAADALRTKAKDAIND